jgi:hypothetical protein
VAGGIMPEIEKTADGRSVQLRGRGRTEEPGGDVRRANMQSSKQYRHNAAVCVKLASEAKEVYAKMALIDLAREFRALAEDLERVRRAAQH